MPRELSAFIQILKKQYEKNPNIERLFYPENSLPLASCYLSLALVQEKKIKVSTESVKGKEPETANDSKESDLEDKMRIHFLHEHERILHIREKIEVTQIPTQCKQTPERIFIEGAAGAGKSTLCRYIAYEWSQNNKTWEKYAWVFYIRLRDLTESRYPETKISFIDVLEKECFQFGDDNQLSESEKNEFLTGLRREPHKVLFVLDGYDELSVNQPKINAFWETLMRSNYAVLITSRPGTTMVPSDIRFETRLAVLGFNDEQVKSYIQKFFDPVHTPDVEPKQADDCLKALKANLNLWSLAHTPIQLEILCSMWGNTLQADSDFSHAKIYALITEKLLKRYEQAQLRQRGQETNIEDIDGSPLLSRYADYLNYMEYLAFLGMKQQVIVIEKQELERAYKIVPQERQTTEDFSILFYKRLKGLGLLKRNSGGTQAEFIHLTFQEYFAARYIAKSIKAFCENRTEGLPHKVLLDFIRTKKWDSFYSVVWWFVAGILGDTPTHVADYEYYPFQESDLSKKELPIPESHRRLQVLQTFFDLLLQEPRAEIGFEEVMLLGKCLEEAKMPLIMQKEAIVKHMRVWWEFYNKKKHDYGLSHTRIALLERTLMSSPVVLRETQIVAALIKALSDDDEDVRSKTASLLGQLNQRTPEVLAALIKALSDEKKYVRTNAADVLGQLNQGTPEVLAALIKALSNDEKKYVRRAAASTLGKLKVGTLEVVSALIRALSDDEEKSIRYTAAFALGELGVRTPQVISALINVLSNKNEHSYVRSDAASALGQLKVVTDEVIFALMKISTGDTFLIKSAASALSQFKLNTFEVACALTKALSSDEDEVRISSIAGTLREIKMNTAEVVSALINALSDENCRSRKRAAEALGALRVSTPKVVSALTEALSDTESSVQSSAVFALGLLKIDIPEVVSALIRALSNTDRSTQSMAIWVLGKLKVDTPEVVSTLIKVISDKDKEGDYWDIKSSAAQALGRLKHCTPEVMSALTNMLLGDHDFFWRSYRQNLVTSILIKLNQITPELISTLTKTLLDNDMDSNRRQLAASVLGQLKVNAPEAVSALIKALSDKDYNVRIKAAAVLGVLKVSTPEVVSALVKALSDEYLDVRRDAAYALIQLNQMSPEVVFALIQVLSYHYNNNAEDAAAALTQLNQIIPEVVTSTLILALSYENPSIRRDAASLLGQFKQAKSEIVSALILAVSDNNSGVRSSAASALGALNQGTPEVLTALMKVLSDEDSDVRWKAASALGSLNQGTPEVLAALVKALSDDNEYVPSTAASALVQLKQTRKLFDAIFPDQPLRIPPSQLIHETADVPKVDAQGNLQVLTLCGSGLRPIIYSDLKSCSLREDFWTLAIVRRKQIQNTKISINDVRFFKSRLDNLTAHAFLIIEGIKNGVRFAKKVDFYAVSSKPSQSSGQQVKIEITDLTYPPKNLTC